MLLTKENDQYGTFNNLRPFSVDVRTGAAAFESGIHIGGNWPAITTSSGTTWHPDGNIQGLKWGGYLSEWLNQNFNGRVDWGTYNRDVGARATIDYVNSRSAVAGGRNAWWYKDEVTGFIIQGGVVNRTDYATRVNFPRGYARECFGVQLTLASTNGNWFGDSRVNIQARDLDNNGFNAMMDGQEQVVLWQSVGV
ncbi:gp53-like domain-containing protein [Serratia marcescens]|uniref:gp53-like domain-containing protein n=1 Tax=Serratia marcescens TaxID=615 RepID=UPI0034A0BD0A